MICIRKLILLGVTTASLFSQASSVSAEARHFEKGYSIDPDIWLEEARIDPMMYFVYPPRNLGRSNKCSDKVSADAAEEFFYRFNLLVEAGVFDLLDVRLVWAMRECRNKYDMMEMLNVSRNTYHRRLAKIRNGVQDRRWFARK